LLFEIPVVQLDRPILMTSTLAGTARPVDINGTLGNDVVLRFERREHRVLVRRVTANSVATDTSRMGARGLALVSLDPLIAILPVDAYGPDSAPVVDVSRLVLGGAPEFLARGARATADPTRSLIDRVAAFPANVNVTVTQTFTVVPGPGAAAPGGAAPAPITEQVTLSFVRLPDEPMRPRLADERIGYFAVGLTDFGAPNFRVEPRRYITRWRLECSERRIGTRCEPQKPITYYVDPATPAWLVPFIKRGVESWQVAFEDAGFARAIVAADAPADPEFTGEDATVSMVRWLPSPVANAVGPAVVDPRSGEILDSDIQMYHNIMDLQRSWYFTQVGHLDPRAQRFPLPDSLMGRLVEYVVAHEVGHTLGFPHNFHASSSYPLDSLRSVSWVRRMGYSASIMDYSRFNYVVQPEDAMPLDLLVPGIGPYDRFAVRWGYAAVPGAATADGERPTLDRWARAQDSVPWFRFAGEWNEWSPDPSDQGESVGDIDPVRATSLGFRNIRRIVPLIARAVSGDSLADHTLMRVTYADLVGQWGQEAAHVTRVVGGSYRQFKVQGQAGPVYTLVPAERQRAAMAFLLAEVFQTPTYLLAPELHARMSADGLVNAVSAQQRSVLVRLLNPAKLQRLQEASFRPDGAQRYPLPEMLTTLRRGLWEDALAGRTPDLLRRRLQLAYIAVMADRIAPATPRAEYAEGPTPASTDVRALLRDELRELHRSITAALPAVRDRELRAHLLEAQFALTPILDPSGR
jgi:hypothetical protein